MKEIEEGPAYRVYMLRSWREGAPAPEAGVVWRYSLEDPNTRQRRGFADLEALSSFLAASAELRSVEGGHDAIDSPFDEDAD